MFLVLGDECLLWYIYFVLLLLSSVHFFELLSKQSLFLCVRIFYIVLYSSVEEEVILFSETDWCEILIMVMNVCMHVCMKVFCVICSGKLRSFHFKFLLLNVH